MKLMLDIMTMHRHMSATVTTKLRASCMCISRALSSDQNAMALYLYYCTIMQLHYISPVTTPRCSPSALYNTYNSIIYNVIWASRSGTKRGQRTPRMPPMHQLLILRKDDNMYIGFKVSTGRERIYCILAVQLQR